MQFHFPAFSASIASIFEYPACDLDFPALLSTFTAYHPHLETPYSSLHKRPMRVDYPRVTFDIGPLLQLSLLTNTALTIFGLRSLDVVGWRLSRGIGGVAGLA